MNNNEQLQAEEIDARITQVQAGRSAVGDVAGVLATTDFAMQLAHLANDLSPDPDFAAELAARLALIPSPHLTRPRPRRVYLWKESLMQRTFNTILSVMNGNPRVRGYLLGGLLGLSLLVGLPVAGQTLLNHFVPRAIPLFSTPALVTAIPTTVIRVQGNGPVDQAAGFHVLLPSYLPPKCGSSLRHAYDAATRTMRMNYGCILIDERITNGVDRPDVEQGSTQTIMVGGRPAIYIDGAWEKADNEAQPTWKHNLTELDFERGNVLITLVGIKLQKEELIRIAESMK